MGDGGEALVEFEWVYKGRVSLLDELGGQNSGARVCDVRVDRGESIFRAKAQSLENCSTFRGPLGASLLKVARRCDVPRRTAHTQRQTDTHTRSAIAMATTLDVVLPGDIIPAHALPTGTGKKKTLTLGPGLRHIPPNTVTSTVAGTLVTDNRKNAALVEYNSGRVRPPS